MADISEDIAGLLTRISERHDFCVVEVGINSCQTTECLFSATLQWIDDGKRDCALATGKSIAEALNKAHRQAVAKRPLVPSLDEAA